jgi:hypothetical protein
MKTRFATVLATMRDFKRVSSQEFKAFVNRRITYEYNRTLDELENIAKGADLIKIKEYNPHRGRQINPALCMNRFLTLGLNSVAI